MSESYFNGWPRSRTIEEVTGPKLIPHRSRRTSLLSYKHFYQKFLIQCFPYIRSFVAACPPQINHQPPQFVFLFFWFLPVRPHRTCSGGMGRHGTCSLRALYPLHFSVQFIFNMSWHVFFPRAVFKRATYRRQRTVFLWSQSVMRPRQHCSEWTVGCSEAASKKRLQYKLCTLSNAVISRYRSITDVRLIRC